MSTKTRFTLPNSDKAADILVSENAEQTLSNKKFKDSNNNEYTIENIAKLNAENTFTDTNYFNNNVYFQGGVVYHLYDDTSETYEYIGRNTGGGNSLVIRYHYNSTLDNRFCVLGLSGYAALVFYHNKIHIGKILDVDYGLTVNSGTLTTPAITLNGTDLSTTLNNCAKLDTSNTFTGNQTIDGKLEITPNNVLGDNLKAVIRDFIYPVGAVYISFVSTSPATLFGGTWEQITNRFLYCANSAGQEKGSSTHTHNNTVSITNASHTLTVNEIPSHTHVTGHYGYHRCQPGDTQKCISLESIPGDDLTTDGFYCENTGGGQGHKHNNTVSITNASDDTLPPCITCYCWQRKA